jgi:hemerythrin-like metal-binding protein
MSEYLRWNPGITLGIDEIDLEHQTFVVMINQLEDHKNDSDMATPILRALVKYAAFHFQSEENAMHAAGYPEIDQHRALHLDLMDHLNIVLLEIRNQLPDFTSILDFFKQWYINHTAKIDMKFAEFLKQRAPHKKKSLAYPAFPRAFRPVSTLLASDLSTLPTTLLERFEQALRAHRCAVATLLAETRRADPALAERLWQIADTIECTTLAALVRAALQHRPPLAAPDVEPDDRPT